MRMRLAVIAAVVVLVMGLPASGQTLLSDIPGYERVRMIRDQMGSLVTGGEISGVRWSEDGSRLQFERDGKHYIFEFAAQTLRERDEDDEDEDARPQARSPRGDRPMRRRPARGQQRDREPSPDDKWTAECRDWNVVIKPEGDGEPIVVTTDGTRKHRYGKASWVYGEELDQVDAMWWSPDSSRLAYYELNETAVKDFFLVSGWTEWRTEPLIEGYPKPGEPNPIARLHIFDLETRKAVAVDVGDESEQYIYNVRFSPDGSVLLFNRTNRKQNVLEVLAADPATGSTRVVVTETQPTWQRNSPEMQFLVDGRRFIWETEKTGWLHYELRDLDGELICTLTHGDYPASRILRVDEDPGFPGGGIMFYLAYSDEHPLNAQLHRVNLDGTDQRRLTRESLNHRITLSPDGEWFITSYEAIDTPPTTALYSTDGTRLATLAESDTSRFDELGLETPELLTFKAADGETDLYGELFKPSDFDPMRTYPLLIDVYGGPLSQRVRNTFSAANPSCELGFLIATIDNRGTPNRGKAFEGATYLQLGTVDLDDQVAGVRHLCERPYVDPDRVGIFGHSYGGYMAALAILKHPDVFAAAVAGSAVTDWRNYDTIYTERFMWIPQENQAGYDAGSCMSFTDQLAGDLLILHGMVDDNVHPNNAWQLIEALYEADKRFDMVFFPNAGHGIGRGGFERQWEFFYRHLIAESPSERSLELVPAGTPGD